MNRKETFLQAIEAEVRSQKLYHALAISFRRPETSIVFQNLVRMEKNHEEKVRKAYLAEFPGPDPVVDPQPGEYRHLNLKDPAVVLEYAMSREDIARDHYLILAEDTDDAQLKDMLLLFAREEEQHREVLKIVLRDPNVSGLIYLNTPPAFMDEEALANNIIAAWSSFPSEERKPMISVIGFGYAVPRLRNMMEEAGMPTIEYPDVAARVMINMVRYSQYKSRFK